MKQRLFVSVSGGRTSGYMAKRLKDEYSREFEMVFGIANTGQEWEETLLFADRCDKEWGLNLVWLEAVVHHGEKVGTTHREVTFETASRNGEPFEEVIKKYGIPCKAYPHCTRELKLQPIRSYLNSIGWKTGTHLTAVGIRADEPRRIRKDAKKAGIIYPLFDLFPTTKPEINDWWEEQPFNLRLEEHQGNCKWCWKKSTKKLVRIAQESPEVFEFPSRMEEMYGLAGHNVDGTKRVFFRNWMNTKGLLQLAGMSPTEMRPADADEDGGCSESCEAFSYEEEILA